MGDDHTLFVEALVKLLSLKFEVVGVAGNGQELQELSRRVQPDVIVTDITMPLMNGLEAIRQLHKEGLTAKVVFLTMHSDWALARQSFKCGGSAFVAKECGYSELVIAIETALDNRLYVSPVIASSVDELMDNSSNTSSEYDQLTQRQQAILQLLAEGKTAKEIAAVMNLSTRTVEWHKYRMMRNLNARNSAELLRCAIRLRFVV